MRWQEGEVVARENKRLREEVKYWREEKEKADGKYAEMVKYKARVELLERDYQRVVSENQHLKEQLQMGSQIPVNMAGLYTFTQSSRTS